LAPRKTERKPHHKASSRLYKQTPPPQPRCCGREKKKPKGPPHDRVIVVGQNERGRGNRSIKTTPTQRGSNTRGAPGSESSYKEIKKRLNALTFRTPEKKPKDRRGEGEFLRRLVLLG